jgi:hypothetical protein
MSEPGHQRRQCGKIDFLRRHQMIAELLRTLTMHECIRTMHGHIRVFFSPHQKFS